MREPPIISCSDNHELAIRPEDTIFVFGIYAAGFCMMIIIFVFELLFEKAKRKV